MACDAAAPVPEPKAASLDRLGVSFGKLEPGRRLGTAPAISDGRALDALVEGSLTVKSAKELGIVICGAIDAAGVSLNLCESIGSDGGRPSNLATSAFVRPLELYGAWMAGAGVGALRSFFSDGSKEAS